MLKKRSAIINDSLHEMLGRWFSRKQLKIKCEVSFVLAIYKECLVLSRFLEDRCIDVTADMNSRAVGDGMSS